MEVPVKPLSDLPAINRFLSYCRIRTVPSKTVLIHAGDLPDVLYYIMTGLPFDGKKAAEMRLVNEAVPRAQLRARVRELADILLEKNPVLKAAKDAFKRVRTMPWDQADEYLYAKTEQMLFLDKSGGKKEGLKQFLDDKTFKPGLGSYKRND